MLQAAKNVPGGFPAARRSRVPAHGPSPQHSPPLLSPPADDSLQAALLSPCFHSLMLAATEEDPKAPRPMPSFVYSNFPGAGAIQEASPTLLFNPHHKRAADASALPAAERRATKQPRTDSPAGSFSLPHHAGDQLPHSGQHASSDGASWQSAFSGVGVRFVLPTSVDAIATINFLPSYLDAGRGSKAGAARVLPRLPTKSSKAVPSGGGTFTSIYRGVTRHRLTGRFESHLWDAQYRRPVAVSSRASPFAPIAEAFGDLWIHFTGLAHAFTGCSPRRCVLADPRCRTRRGAPRVVRFTWADMPRRRPRRARTISRRWPSWGPARPPT